MSESWLTAAACRNEDVELFFPSGSTSSNAVATIRAAKEVCASCDVREACLEYALDNNIDAGVWGGLDEDERRSLRRKIKREEREQREQRQAS